MQATQHKPSHTRSHSDTPPCRLWCISVRTPSQPRSRRSETVKQVLETWRKKLELGSCGPSNSVDLIPEFISKCTSTIAMTHAPSCPITIDCPLMEP